MENWWWVPSQHEGIASSEYTSLQFQIPQPGRRMPSSTYGMWCELLEAYTFPPLVWSSLLASTCLTVVPVALIWPHQEWFLNLLSLLVNEQLQLQVIWDLPNQSQVRMFHQASTLGRCNDLSESQAFWGRLRNMLQHMDFCVFTKR